MTERPPDRDYQRLLELRAGLRRFLHWSESQAQAAGTTPAQHQLLLAIRGHDDSRGAIIASLRVTGHQVPYAGRVTGESAAGRQSGETGKNRTASLELVDRGCPAELAARILAPLQAKDEAR